jgi:hypothetical protein
VETDGKNRLLNFIIDIYYKMSTVVPCSQYTIAGGDPFTSGSTFSNALFYLSTAVAGDVIIYSSVAFYLGSQTTTGQFITLLNQKLSDGVNLILLEDTYEWESPTSPFYMKQDIDRETLNILKAQSNCYTMKFTGNYLQIHLKSFDLISFASKSAYIYYGSSNFYDSGHEEVGMYVTGNYETNNIVFSSLVSRLTVLLNSSGTSPVILPTKPGFSEILDKLNGITSSYKPDKQNGLYFDVDDNTSYQLSPLETMVCNSTTNSNYKSIPIGVNAPVKVIGGYRISMSPPVKGTFSEMFADEIDLITNVIDNSTKYVKIAVMESYLDLYHPNGSDPVLTKFANSIIKAVKDGKHVMLITNVKVNWADTHSYPTPMNFTKLTSEMKGPGTFQCRYNGTVSSLHTKLYVGDNDVLISSQHPSSAFLDHIVGSSIMFNDPTIRLYYDNYFNLLWTHTTKNMVPIGNTYPYGVGDWFQNNSNLILCNEKNKGSDQAFLTSCCVDKFTTDYERKITYDLIFTDPNCSNMGDKSKFYGWWFDQIQQAKSFISVVSSPVSSLGSISYWSPKIGATVNKTLLAYLDINAKIYWAYIDALYRGVKIYLFDGPGDPTSDLVFDLTKSGFGKVGTNIFIYKSNVFYHEKLYATENTTYVGSQNALLPDSYEAGYAFYNTIGSGVLNPMYFETLKRIQQYVNIESGYKEIEYNIENQCDTVWVNKTSGVVNGSESKTFLAFSPGVSATGLSAYNNKYANTMMGPNATTETEALLSIIDEADEYLKIATYDWGNQSTWQPGSRWWGGLTAGVIAAAKKNIDVTLVIPRQGTSGRLAVSSTACKPTSKTDAECAAYFRDALIAMMDAGVKIHIIDPLCPDSAVNTDYWLGRKCHMVHSKFILSEKAVFNSSSNFSTEYLEGSIRNTGVYVKGVKDVLTGFSDFFDLILSDKSCYTTPKTVDDLSKPCGGFSKPMAVFNQKCYDTRYCDVSTDCSNNAISVTGASPDCECECDSSWSGKDCSVKKCDSGWSGVDCNINDNTTSFNKTPLIILGTCVLLILIIWIVFKYIKK